MITSGYGSFGGITNVYFPVQTKQYIKIVQVGSSDTYWWTIVDLNVLYESTASIPLDRSGWILSGSGIHFSDAIDNKSGTCWTTNAIQANGQYLEINMGSPKTFSSLRMDAYGNYWDYPRAYEVYVSNDGTNWGSAIATGTGRFGITDVSFTEQTKQYIKILQTGSHPGNWWTIEELNVYTDTGVAPTPPPTALAKTGWTLSGTDSNFSNAIDNDSSTYWTTNASTSKWSVCNSQYGLS